MLKILDKACTPIKGSELSACIDLRTREDIVIKEGEFKLIPLGVKIDKEFVDKYFKLWSLEQSCHYMQLMLRSSLSKKLIIANGVGIIDMDYEGEIMIRVHNPMRNAESRTVVSIEKGERVAQITLLEQKVRLFGFETEEKREGGFGSTGKK